MNYQFFYGLTFNPFDKDLPSQYVFESSDYKQFISRMEYFKSTKGFACVYGEPGSGKTTSLRAFTAKINPQLFRVIYLPLSTTTVQDFYRHLAVGLGLLPKFRKVDLFHQIQVQIVKSAMQKNLTTFIIIDEAQFVQHAIFHELRLLFNFQMDSKNYACILFIGQPLLLNLLSLQIHLPLKQRIAIHYGFKGLSKDEIAPYLVAMLKAAGVGEPLFTPEAIEAIYAFSGGLPRKINSLAEKALLLGSQKRTKSINAEIIQTVQDDSEMVL